MTRFAEKIDNANDFFQNFFIATTPTRHDGHFGILGAQACALPISSKRYGRNLRRQSPQHCFYFAKLWVAILRHSYIYIYIENLEISQERLNGFWIFLAQQKRNSMIQMSDEKNFEIRKIDKVMNDFVSKIGLKRLFLNILS